MRGKSGLGTLERFVGVRGPMSCERRGVSHVVKASRVPEYQLRQVS